MALRYLWAGWPCQRPVIRPRSPRGDASEVPVDRVAVPKTVQKTSSPREDASGAPMDGVAVPKTVQKPPFAT
ncbi:MAG: hypothetical protein PUD74_07695, partial [Bacteroidales bacterium]|nr:hypothetical protein [Bacteroidales bacterium]